MKRRDQILIVTFLFLLSSLGIRSYASQLVSYTNQVVGKPCTQPENGNLVKNPSGALLECRKSGSKYVWMVSATKASALVVATPKPTAKPTAKSVSGISAVPGSQGVQGIQGVQGVQGVKGVQGKVGTTGVQGVQGKVGTTGKQGVQGQVGTTRSIGLTGDTGASGEAGATGATGSIGADGSIGITGATGLNGVIGASGSSGATGAAGLTGSAGPAGAAGATGAVGPSGGFGDRGSFYSTQSQYVPASRDSYNCPTTTPAPLPQTTPMTFDQVDSASTSGVTMVNNSKITFSHAGTYNIAFSAQIRNVCATTPSSNVVIWLAIDGIDVPFSSTLMYYDKYDKKQPEAWNFFVTVSAGSYCQLMWWDQYANSSIWAEAAQATPVSIPAVPSVILTVNQVG